VTSLTTTPVEISKNRMMVNRFIGKILKTRQLFLVIMILVLIIGLASISSTFLSYRNIMALVSNEAIKGFILVGVLLLLITGEFDLSVGAGMALVGVCMAYVSAQTNLAIGIVVGSGVGLLLGIINGFLVTKLKMASFIATLGMMNMARSLCNVITQGKAIPLNNSKIVEFFNQYILGLPITFIMLIIFIVIMAILLTRHKYFKKLFYTGINDRGAAMVGINTNRLRWAMFIFSGLMIALAGVFYTSMLSSAVPLGFSGLEMSLIAMSVIGGASLKGGQGTVIGCILGLVLLTLIGNGMTVIGISPQWAGAILGIILILASILDVTLQNKTN
jgi:ribose transport system permease protein